MEEAAEEEDAVAEEEDAYRAEECIGDAGAPNGLCSCCCCCSELRADKCMCANGTGLVWLECGDGGGCC